MSSKQGNSGRIARRVISLGSARLRLLFVPVMIAWALLGVGLGAVQQAQAQSRDEDRWWWRTAYRGDALQIAHLEARKAVRQRGRGFARSR